MPRGLFFFSIFLIFAVSALGSEKNPCPQIEFSEPISPDFSATEKRLICGDPESDAWRKIPISQAQQNLTNFLQVRGYLHPKMERVENTLRVTPGLKTKVTSLKEEGAPESFHLERKRKIVGEALTPSTLNALEGWSKSELQRIGYACPKVVAQGDPNTGEVLLHVTPGELQNLSDVTEENIPGLAKGVLRRYDAFMIGKPYNGDEVSLTENRLKSFGGVESAHFNPRCDESGVHLQQRTVPGQPRVVAFGVGVNTEGLFLLNGSWSLQRIGNRDSSLNAAAEATSQIQTLNFNYNWYLNSSHFSMIPLLQVTHDNEQPYETGDTRAQYGFRNTWDFPGVGFSALVGPTWDYFRTYRGFGPSSSEFLSIEGQIQVKSHDFEYHATQPRDGFQASIVGDFSSREFFANCSAQRIGVNGEKLWNFRDYDPALLIFGIRGGANFIFTPEQPGTSQLLPQNFLQYLGGNSNLRGFGLQELPLSGLGGLTSFFTDFEIRVATVFPLNLEPFVFFDLGGVGENILSVDSPIYYSPGIGIRWASPFGTFRTTLAHGFPLDIGHYQFYFSFGQEF